MSFIQIEDLHTDHIAEISELGDQWRRDTAGRRTLLSDRVYVDRNDPTHYVAVNEFTSYESAMVNSALPETDAIAARFAALVTGDVTYIDLDLVTAHDARSELADAFRHDVEQSALTSSTYTDDVLFEGMFPQALVRVTGPDAVTALLAEDAAGRTVETWDVQPTPTGFALEYAWRTTGAPSYLSVGTALVTVTDGRISRILCTCAGSWDEAAEAAITGAITAGSAS
ncbi:MULTISPECIES: hypothetical protein [unclassified Nocardioides]|uniref:hypothetical protein n=1 Tax=unclassified Nocardioides TaxID=2615069 RepID=UPI0006F8D91B|nr:MULTISPECIES: hypothetical protein [unclassified Nocardioides]KRA37258.1 hypothetical protein ASD81_00495 [Nocardioides sp. Root614]KRA91219.1 hypothetical protein ASD84_00760 [Nocardioides sp. Root682]